MTVACGDVVLVDFPFSSGRGAKVRPALVVQNDRDNARLTNTIVAMITGQSRGWAVLKSDELHGEFFIHDSGRAAKRRLLVSTLSASRLV